VYYLSYLDPNFKNWWVVYKVRPKMHTHQYDEFIKEHDDDDDIYQKKIEVDQNFMVFDGASLTELDTGDVELLDKEAGP
jgi:hypothetical protein